jgi:serine/threonine protein kinase
MPINSRFEFDSLIGKGGMSEVYKVFDNDLKKICALKVSKYPFDENEIDKTINEATLWFKFRKFAHVVEVYEIIRLEDLRIGILMEFMNGGSLASIVSGKVSLDDKYLALFDISSAIINCCSAIPAFSHLDIKPENCLRTKCGLTKLSDFGTSCYVKSGLKGIFANKQNIDVSLSLPLRTNNGIRCAGTPLYMAPEQIIGSIVDRQKSDVYSFGILALELLSGVHPLQGINNLDDIFNEHIRGIRNELRKWPENIHPKLIHLFDSAISPNPNDRPNFQEINEHLKSAYGGPRPMLVSGLEKLSDSIEDASRKGKSLWAIGHAKLLHQ